MNSPTANIKIKICGLNDEAAVKAVINSGADFAGFVHHQKSRRHVSLDDAAKLKSLLPSSIKSVVVVVDPDNQLIAEIVNQVKPDYIQLHGDETAEMIREMRSIHPDIKIIKAISVSNNDDIQKYKGFGNLADFILFDAKATSSKMLKGGNGISFDWELLKGDKPEKNWILSGGLTPGNVKEAIAITGAEFIDVSSGVEIKVGIKDASLVDYFVRTVRS